MGMLLIVVLFGVGEVLFAADREVLVCDAKALEAFDHREVSINAIWSVSLDSESFEGAFCDPTKIGGALLIAGERGSPAVDFRTEVDMEQASRAFRSPRTGWGQVCGRFTGRLFVKKGFRYDPETMRGNGSGSNGQNPWALVLRSVSNLHSCAKWR